MYAGRVACCPLVSFGECADRTDRRTDGWTDVTSLHYTFRYGRRQRNKWPPESLLEKLDMSRLDSKTCPAFENWHNVWSLSPRRQHDARRHRSGTTIACIEEIQRREIRDTTDDCLDARGLAILGLQDNLHDDYDDDSDSGVSVNDDHVSDVAAPTDNDDVNNVCDFYNVSSHVQS